MRQLERFILLQIIDDRWREHLHDMDYLREGIHLRGFAQEDPLVAYKNEARTIFEELINSIWEEFARYIFHVEVEVEGEDNAALGPGLERRRGAAASATPAGPPRTSRAHSRQLLRARPRRAQPVAPARAAARPFRAPATASRLRWRSRSSSASSRTRSGATTRAPAAPARNTRSATGPSWLT